MHSTGAVSLGYCHSAASSVDKVWSATGQGILPGLVPDHLEVAQVPIKGSGNAVANGQ